jgi:RES domain-containing protein
MAHRVLDRPLRVFRIGDPKGRFKIFSGEGSRLVEGRWHARGQNVIYASEHYSLALLEKLAHFNGTLPSGQHAIRIDVPAGVSYEVVTKDSLPRWCLPGDTSARRFGATWFSEQRTALLLVPSFVAREERNVLINPHHADAHRITPGLEEPVVWDARLYGISPRA